MCIPLFFHKTAGGTRSIFLPPFLCKFREYGIIIAKRLLYHLFHDYTMSGVSFRADHLGLHRRYGIMIAKRLLYTLFHDYTMSGISFRADHLDLYRRYGIMIDIPCGYICIDNIYFGIICFIPAAAYQTAYGDSFLPQFYTAAFDINNYEIYFCMKETCCEKPGENQEFFHHCAH